MLGIGIKAKLKPFIDDAPGHVAMLGIGIKAKLLCTMCRG